MSTTIDPRQIPNLTTALDGPLYELEQCLLTKQVAIETWFRQQWLHVSPPITASVDIRNAGFKLAPVDTNLFPAGFNNLNRDFLPLCVQAAQASLAQVMPSCKRILLIPENHTRNEFYFHSLATLHEILTTAGYDVRVGSLIPGMTEPNKVTAPNGYQFTLEPVQRRENQLVLADFTPCLVLLNNDLSDAIPDILIGLEQIILPSHKLGWSSRLKSQHFHHYAAVAREFAEFLKIDPWLICPAFTVCHDVDFLHQRGEDALIAATQNILDNTTQKYQHFGIQQKPFAVIKADSGTYGMGVMMVKSVEELKTLNRKQRKRMSATKGSQKIEKVIIQEGVYTFETWGEDSAVAEPVVYMLGQFVVGGFYRVHKGRGDAENLNAPGMHFEPLAFATACNTPNVHKHVDDSVNRFYAYGIIARLAGLAAAREALQLEKNA